MIRNASGQLASSLPSLVRPIGGAAVGILFMIAALAALGANPVAVSALIADAVFGSPPQQVDAIVQAVPIGLMALGYCFSFRASFWNIGGEAYFYLGATVAMTIGLKVHNLPAPVTVVLMTLGGALAGGALSAIAGLLRAYRDINEVVVTLMMNLVMVQIVAFAATGPLANPLSNLGFSEPIPASLWLPTLGLTGPHMGALALVPALIVSYYLLTRSGFGDRIRVVGANPDTARANGIPVARTLIMVSIATGVLGGLAGVAHAVGSTHRVYVGLSPAPGFGYIAIIAALLGANRPIGALLAAFFYTFLSEVSDGLQVQFGIDRSFITVFFVLTLVSVLAANAIPRRQQRAAPT